MTFEVGDRVVAESESIERRARTGTVRAMLRKDPAARYRTEWDDGPRRCTHRRQGRCTSSAHTRSLGADD